MRNQRQSGHRIEAVKAIVAWCLFLSMIVTSPTAAVSQEQDATAAKEIALQGVWDAHAEGYGYWTWDKDGSVCLRLNDPAGDCADSGTWAMKGDSICYEFEWWGEGEDVKAACISVIAHKDQPFEVIILGDTMNATMFHFTLLE